MILLEPKLIVVLATTLVVALVVVFHYEVIRLLYRRLCSQRPEALRESLHRPTILMAMFVLLFAHVAEIWAFGTVYWLLLEMEGYGAITGYSVLSLEDYVYFSASTYTTVGWGDLAATGHIRFLAGTESLVGFLMITWSASFSYLIMARTWGEGRD